MHAYGGPEVLVQEDVPTPALRPDDVLVRVRAAGVNPVDGMIRGGYGRESFGHTLPLILGVDVAGTVEAIGPEAQGWTIGDAVYGYTSLSRDGAYAEFVAASATDFAPKPDALSFEQAAALPVGVLTAWQAFEAGALAPGQSVLIHAAAGGVGSLAVQLAKALGAGRVIGTASPRNRDFVLERGADEVIDYTSTRFEDVLENIDFVLDTLAGDTRTRSYQVLRPGGGVLVSLLGAPDQAEAAQHNVRATSINVTPDGARLRQVNELIAAGKITPPPLTLLPLAQARRAQEQSATGHVRGKIVLTPGA